MRVEESRGRALQRMTVEECEAWAGRRPERYELVDRVPRMMRARPSRTASGER